MAGDGSRSGSARARFGRLVTTVALAIGAVMAAATVAAAQTPSPGAGGSVGQTLTVVVPARDPGVPPGGPGAGGGAEPGAGASRGGRAGPVTAAAPSGALPRTGVGPWFWPTVAAALALMVVGAVLTSVGGRLHRRAIS